MAKPKLKPKPAPPKYFNLDKRAAFLLQHPMAKGPADEALDTFQVAEWFGVSHQWLEIGRSLGYGPKYDKPGERCVTYTRGECNKFLKQREKVWGR